MRSALLLSAVFLAFGAPTHLLLATDYFVSGAGNDASNGLSSATAFRSITRAMASAGAGDRVIVQSGTYSDAPNPAGEETFPIVVSDGVEILGPGNGSAFVNAASGAGDAFLVSGLTNTTIVSGLRIACDNGTSIGAAFRVVGAPADLRILSNEMINGTFLLSNVSFTAAAGAADITVEGNSVDASNGIVWLTTGSSSPHRLTVRNNTIQTGYNAGVYLSAANGGDISATVRDNVIVGTGATFRGLFLAGRSNNGSSPTITANVRGNTFSGFSTGVDALAIASLAPTSNTEIDLLMRNNVVDLCGVGFHATASASSPNVRAAIVGDLQANAFRNSLGDGIETLALARLGGLAEIGPEILQNQSTRGSGNGALFFASASSNGIARVDPILRGNVFSANSVAGIAVSGNAMAGGQAEFSPDFGHSSAAGFGRNTFSGNAGPDFSLAGLVNDTVVVEAMGNWWGATSTAGIEAGVIHQADNPNLGMLDFAPFIMSPLHFTADVGVVTPGQTLTLTAEEMTPFLDRAGLLLLTATLSGLPATVVSVDPAGETVEVQLPPTFPFAGQQTLVVTNPGGQTGSLLIASTGLPAGEGSGGKCFVATAAYGDDEAPEVRVLRRWRDEHLAGCALGRGLVRAYYALSPGVAQAVAERPAARGATRLALAPVVGAVKLWMEAPWACLIGGAAAWLWLRRRR